MQLAKYGANAGYQEVKNIELKDGRYISQKDIDDSKKVAVVSDKFVSKMFKNDKKLTTKT